MHMLRHATLGLLLLVAPITAAMAQSQVVQASGQCAAGTRLLTHEEAVSRRDEVCRALDRWSVARLADGASMDGPGYHCQIKAQDNRQLGHALCTTATEPEIGGDHRHMLEAFERERFENPSPYSLNPNLVHLVDRHAGAGNFLFRGDMPVANGSFQYDALVQALRASAAEYGTPLPTSFKVIDISLVNELTSEEKQRLAAEKAYWTAHPERGQLISNPIYGSLTSPKLYPSAERRKLAARPSIGHLGDLVDRMRTLLTSPTADGIPVVLYVHCEAGKDRTGEVIGAYAMKYLGMPYSMALAHAEGIAGRKISTFNKNGLQWYAHQLADKGWTTIGPIH
jgi:hypothetical protein